MTLPLYVKEHALKAFNVVQIRLNKLKLLNLPINNRDLSDIFISVFRNELQQYNLQGNLRQIKGRNIIIETNKEYTINKIITYFSNYDDFKINKLFDLEVNKDFKNQNNIELEFNSIFTTIKNYKF